MNGQETSCSNESAVAPTDDDNFITTHSDISSKLEKSRYTLNWTIHDFNCKTLKKGQELPSINFQFGLGSHALFDGKLSIRGSEFKKMKICLDLKTDIATNWSVDCALEINESQFEFNIGNNCLSWYIYLCENDCHLNNEGINTVRVEIERLAYIQVEQTALRVMQKSALQTDMEKLFESKIMSDIVFDVAGEKLPAHKVIIATRSKFLADIFELRAVDEMVNPNILIKDTEPEVFNAILRYIYTDKVPSLKQISKKLLIASQNYGLETLKLICETELINKIDSETVSELLILADENKAELLKRHAVGFIKKHSKAVAATLGWQNIKDNKLHLLAELYTAIIE